jgi:hypothetical protein
MTRHGLFLLLTVVAQAFRPAVPYLFAQPGKPAAERPVPFKPGETLTYDVSWSMYLTAGSATVSVRAKKPSNGSTVYDIVAEGRPTPLLSNLYTLYYKVDTLLDVYTLLPQRGSVYSEEGGRKRLKTTVFDQGSGKATYEVKTATVESNDLKLPAGTQDALGAFFALRSIPLKADSTMTMPVSDSGRVYQVKVTVGAREAVQTGFGEVQAWKLTPVVLDEGGRPNGQQLAVWISDDARRLPVKLQAGLAVGSFVLVLRDAGAS